MSFLLAIRVLSGIWVLDNSLMYRGCVVIAVIGCFCETLGWKIVARQPGSIFYSAWCSVFLFKLLVSDMVFLALFLAMSAAGNTRDS